MNEETITKIINQQAERIIEEIKGGQLYGRPVNIDNSNELIFAAYLLGQTKEKTFYTFDKNGLMKP